MSGSSSAAKPASAAKGVPLRWQRPKVFPQLARFVDESDFATLTSLPVPPPAADKPYMYMEKEEIREDEQEDELDEQLDYVERRKRDEQRRRYSLHPKHFLYLSNPSKSLNLEGKVGNLDLADSENVSKSRRMGDKEREGEQEDFHYCLFQFVEREADGVVHKEINVIPVGSLYSMRKANTAPELLLSEVEEKYLRERQLLKERILRTHGRVASAIVRANGAAGRDNDAAEEGLDEEEMVKKKFEVAMSSAFARGAKASSARKGKDGAAGGAEDGDRVRLNEIGHDEDELRDAEFKGDFGGRFIDDEEDHVEIEMVANKETVEREYGEAWRREQDEQLELDDVEEAAEEEETQEKDDGGSGLVSEELLKAAQQSKKAIDGALIAEEAEKLALLQQQQGTSKTTTVAAPAAELAMTKNALKRGTAGGPSDQPKKRVRIADEQALPAVAALDYDLNDDGLRRYIGANGGKVNAEQTFKFFKPKMDAFAKQIGKKKAGVNKFLDMIERLTVTVDDAVMGKCLRVKA